MADPIHPAVACRAIQAAVACHFERGVIDIKSDRVDAPTVLARRVAMYLCHELYHLGSAVIAREFNKHASVVADAIKVIRGNETYLAIAYEIGSRYWGENESYLPPTGFDEGAPSRSRVA